MNSSRIQLTSFAAHVKHSRMKSSVASPASVVNLRCEYLTNPLGIEEAKPRLSWQMRDARRGARQTAYQILVASSAQLLAQDKGDLWNGKRVKSDESVHIEYAGKQLQSRLRCFWKVRVWDKDGAPTAWSETAWFELAFLSPSDWSAEWIGLRDETIPPPAVYVRKSFRIGQASSLSLNQKTDKQDACPTIKRARIYATAQGVYELQLNGSRVGDHILAPGFTHARKRVLYQTFDVTAQLRAGENVVGAILGDGWCHGELMGGKRDHFGEPPARFLAQLEIEFEDGTTQRIVTDASWKACNKGAIRSSSIYHGEFYDARMKLTGWHQAGFNDRDWKPVEVFPDTGAVRTAQQDPPIRVTQELKPISVTEHKPGVFIFDMGQNMVGFCRLQARGAAGTKIQMRHAEVLNKDGSIYTENLRAAKATDTFILCGNGNVETFVPHFTYHGFRFVEVTMYDKDGGAGVPPVHPFKKPVETPAPPFSITGLVLHTDCPMSGSLETSSKLVNQLQSNIVWGQRGNMHSVLTDCPQRDERLGWMGDAQVFARTACFNMDMAAMLEKFSRDMRDSQSKEGSFTDISPVMGDFARGAPAWADAGVILPWIVYRCYNDRRLLERQYDAMKRQVDYVGDRNPIGIWATPRGNDYGDWVPAGSKTDKTAFATLNWFHCAKIVTAAAIALGRRDDAKKYGALVEKIRGAFNRLYLVNGHYLDATQTVNAMALRLGIVPEKNRAAVAKDLVADIKKRKWHLSTGFSGTQMLLPALSDAGYNDVAIRLLLNRDYPSWGYMIAKGATTIWELWNSDTEGPSMNSRNHFAFGAVGEWLFRYLAGIDLGSYERNRVDDAGYKRILIHPRIPTRSTLHASRSNELNWVKASYESIHGRIGSEWKIEKNTLELKVEIPANTRATVVIPAASAKQITESGQPLAKAKGISRVRKTKDGVVCEVGAGSYEFAAT
jgi:alpha-L-rhamnosidase